MYIATICLRARVTHQTYFRVHAITRYLAIGQDYQPITMQVNSTPLYVWETGTSLGTDSCIEHPLTYRSTDGHCLGSGGHCLSVVVTVCQ